MTNFLHHVAEFLGCADYWLERYQTLLVGIAAIIGVIYATDPVKKQLDLQQRQYVQQKRERLAATYRMIDQIASDLERLNGPTDGLPTPPRPADQELATNEYSEQAKVLLEARIDRVSSLEDRILALDISDQMKSLVRDTSEKSRETLRGYRSVINNLPMDLDTMQFAGSQWWYATEQADRIVNGAFRGIAAHLRREQSNLVSQIVSADASGE